LEDLEEFDKYFPACQNCRWWKLAKFGWGECKSKRFKHKEPLYVKYDFFCEGFENKQGIK